MNDEQEMVWSVGYLYSHRTGATEETAEKFIHRAAILAHSLIKIPNWN
jgi:hypothetical protein